MALTPHQLFDGLWKDYVALNPHAKAVHDALTARGERPVNDHVAFRTFDRPGVDMYALAELFEAVGYEPAEFYDIADKKVDALYLALDGHPRVFISQLRVDEFPAAVGTAVDALVAQVPDGAAADPAFLWNGRPWAPPTVATYATLKSASDYAAWVAAFGYRTNHFTVSVNDLAFTRDIRELNAFLKANGFRLNAEGGEVKGSPDELLEQSSTMAEPVTVAFADGLRKVPACYYEFAKRYPDANGRPYDGFIATSASKIFESTNG